MKRFAPLLLLLLFAGCATTAPAPSPAPSPAVTANEMSLAVHWSRNSAEHRALFIESYALAAARLGELVAGLEPGTWAVALDADETVLDNSLYQKELEEKGASFSQESWGEWVRREAAPALPGARRFLEHTRELGGKIAIVTNRSEPLCPATRVNFQKEDLPYDVILCRGEESSKEARWKKVEEGEAAPGLPSLTIVMWLGDNIHDFPGGEQDWRQAPESALEDFGRRFFVLPNPMYGSWARNPED